MGTFDYAHALRVIVLACGIALLLPAINSRAATLDSPGSLEMTSRSTEPFGLVAHPLAFGGLHEKWLGVERKLDDERVQLALCDGDRDRCASPAALQFLAIVDVAREHDGRARLGQINRAINLAIRPMSDFAQYGEIDVWSSPLVTFYRGAGDCEDYAIAKFVALRRAGVAPDDLRIVIMHDPVRDEDHAITAARLDGRWLTLDNRRMAMVEDVYLSNYRPIFLIDAEGVKRYRDATPQGEDQQVASVATQHSATETSPL